MKQWLKPTEFLYWLSCVATFWITAIMYPHNVYLAESKNVPSLSLGEIALLAGVLLLLGTAMYLLLALIGFLGKWVGLKKNLIVFFFYHYIVCSVFGVGVDHLFPFIKFSPFWIYLLLGFVPAMICSIIRSYEVSHHGNKK